MLLGFIPNAIQAQQKNTVKFNLLPLVSKTFAFEYEREFKPNMTLNTSIGFRGKSSIPFKNLWEDIIEDEKFLSDAKLSHFTLSPELRFYTSRRKEGARGFYVGPFIKYAKYNFSTNYEYETDEGNFSELPINGGIGTWSAGVAIGSQFKLSKSIFLDFRILGPHYGFSDVNLKGKQSLTQHEQDYLREELQDLENDFIKIETEVNSEGVTMKAKGPWAGIRAGLSIGYRF